MMARKFLLVALAALVVGGSTGFGTRFLAGAGMYGYGDSFGVAAGASDQAHGFSYLLAAQIGGTFNNYAVSGTRTANAARAALTTLPVNRRGVAMVQSGFNDILTGAAVSSIQANHRAIIAASLLRENVPASAMRSSGTWISYGSSDPGRANAIGGTAMYSTDINAWREWDFFGDNVVVGSYTTGNPGNTYKDFYVSIDGGPPATFAAHGMTSETYPATGFNALVLRGLGLGKHTVRTYQNPGAPGVYIVVDYVGTLVAPGATGPLLVGDIPSMTNWTYNGLTINQAIEDTANAGIASVIAEFADYQVFGVPTNSTYTPGACCTISDGEHPNNTGHAQLAAAYWTVVSHTGP